MNPTGKLDGASGIITIAIAGISGSFTPADFHEWGTTFLSLSPFVLILFLIWRIRQLDKQHAECTNNHLKTQEQLVLAYHAITDITNTRNLPSVAEFKAGNFNLPTCIREKETHD